ncbi:ribonuclease H-like domain-containing protein [Mycena epipterygia]|nr:ribonuclease H-like domain-containing protein [Mycena epipterygia]
MEEQLAPGSGFSNAEHSSSNAENNLIFDDDEDDPFVNGDGLGTENEGLPDDDEDDDTGKSNSVKSLHKRQPLPSWLQTAYKEKLKEASLLYSDHQTFWFPQKSTYFLLCRRPISPVNLYNPRFFYWDPELLCRPSGIPCPTCGKKLVRHGWIARPRRCVDLYQTFWMIGYRYRCPECTNPTSGKTTVTFNSWDSRILAKLPPALATEFPARLSHHSAISHKTFGYMRSCFQNGMGPKPFSDAIRMCYLQRYDELQLQYLQSIAEGLSFANWTGQKFDACLPFENSSDDGYHGFVPSGQWLRDMYDDFIEEHNQDYNQHRSMLSNEIGALDHSHKLTKHLARVNGVPIFCGTFIMTNEKGEIRVFILVPKKAHSQIEPALTQVRESLHLYGHSQPKLIYTDNMSDKPFLEKCYNSLLEDLVPVDKYSSLPLLQIPDDVDILVRKTAPSIDDAIRTILDSLMPDGTLEPIAIGFNSEWNVDVSSHGYVQGRGETAVIQIAYERRVYVLQVASMIAENSLPQQLKLLLENPNVLKVGKLVTADLRYLEQVCGSKTPFVGGVDLATFAKDRDQIPTANVGLADLCASILGKQLRKNVSDRISTSWEKENLTDSQINYSALDAWAALSIYHALNHIPLPGALPLNPAAGIPVALYNTDKSRIIARGSISTHSLRELMQ